MAFTLNIYLSSVSFLSYMLKRKTEGRVELYIDASECSGPFEDAKKKTLEKVNGIGSYTNTWGPGPVSSEH